MTIYYQTIPSPVGDLLIAADDHGLRLIEFPDPRHPMAKPEQWQSGEHPLLVETRRQLDEYFSGQRERFDLPLAPEGTAFQQQVWMSLRDIGYGQTISYRQLAERIGNVKAMRAVGAANGRNPLPIVVPCHRVIGADGSLTGFGGGLPTKQFLLQLEGALPRSQPAADLFAH
ncbi:methylated-DNA--[protein]-cysteine S-methyltransferase [Pseudoxanthomonas dokdonensis]|uniref:Methylated-DNA--protein-cysteine methyltransferase n=1 Tax=Pseudoxanthomonas dokdonensis TaxID=344882 RepID=A0A0R0CP64_9GAMM|nr:methylated-DNA--[protein]-cysteine S-methyltransferase [Pseudoxanthomonas dokdonensis]KRG68194.1 cysteine methyltransferase [Pseudoxanthomonas dokdonensis]